MDLSRGEELVSCPYNKSHRLLRKHLQKHLIKCKLSYPDAELQQCPFNTTHLIPEEEYPIHITVCPDRALITNYKYSSGVSTAPHAPIQVEKKFVDDTDESWDDENCPAYNPLVYAAAAPIIRSNIGSIPSKRKEFTKNELERHKKFTNRNSE